MPRFTHTACLYRPTSISAFTLHEGVGVRVCTIYMYIHTYIRTYIHTHNLLTYSLSLSLSLPSLHSLRSRSSYPPLSERSWKMLPAPHHFCGAPHEGCGGGRGPETRVRLRGRFTSAWAWLEVHGTYITWLVL